MKKIIFIAVISFIFFNNITLASTNNSLKRYLEKENIEKGSTQIYLLNRCSAIYAYASAVILKTDTVNSKKFIEIANNLLLKSVELGVIENKEKLEVSQKKAEKERKSLFENYISEGKKNWEKIPGVISRSENDYIFSEQRDLIHDLDSLPYPAYELFPIEEVYFKNSALMYSEEGMKATRRLDINASIGCSLVCKFCYHLGIAGDMKYKKDSDGKVLNVEFDTKNNYTRNIRYNTPEYIVNLVLYLKKKYDVNFINFLDENLMTMDVFSKRTWLKEICRLWKEAGLVPKKNKDGTWKGVHWSGTSHATLCNKEVLKMMADHGCSHLVYGYESFDDRILKTIGKGATVKTNLRSFFWTLESGIRPIPCQMFGFPDDDFESIRKNMRAWDELGIVVKPTFATAYPGSEWYTKYKDKILDQYKGVGKKMGLSDDLEAYIVDLGDATRVTGVISKNFNSVELIGLREMMLQKQYHKVDEYEAQWNEKNKSKKVLESQKSLSDENQTNILNIN